MAVDRTGIKPAPGARTRFLAKKVGEGRAAIWGVYDIARGSYPYQTAELGLVAQDHAKEADAQVEAERLNTTHGGIDEVKVRQARKAMKKDPGEPTPADDDD